MKTVIVRNVFTAVASFCLIVCVFGDSGGGLALNFYDKTCPEVYNAVENVVGEYISKTPTLAAPLLRMHFHDCFVRVSIFMFTVYTPVIRQYI